MKRLVLVCVWLWMSSVVWAVPYNGALPPGSSCPEAICKSCSFDSSRFVAPVCVGGWTAGVYNVSETAMYLYASQCPWCQTSYCNAIYPETCCGVRMPPADPPVYLLTGDKCAEVGCAGPCSPYDGGDNGCPPTEGKVYCKSSGSCQYSDNPCGENMQWNYKTCVCDCNYTDNNKFRFSKQVGDIQSCYEGDPLNFDGWSWLWVDMYRNVVPGYFKRDTVSGVTLYRVDYSLDWNLDDPCEYDSCPAGWSLYYSPVASSIVPDIGFKYRVYDWSDAGGGHQINTVYPTEYVFQKGQDSLKDDGSIYVPASLVVLCGEFQTWQLSCPWVEELGLIVYWYDRSNDPYCSSNSQTFKISEAKGNDLSGIGIFAKPGGEKMGLKIHGFGGVEFHDN